MSQFKRQNLPFSNGQNASIDSTTQQLQSIGMRIRKSVNDGYMLPNQQHSNNSYLSDYERQHISKLQQTTLNRGPPALSFGVSTASSLSDWESNANVMKAPMQSLPSFSTSIGSRKKRSRDDDIEENNYSSYSNPVIFNNAPAASASSNEKGLNDFVNQYGPLSFNEDF
ncbi:unnamed protein product [Ambrosiozyma monospora]|uniref:Damage-regulated import facilitator 1 n=1 Tax=Ambrosiozyma monospora TaxID=43982 RepID=A0A9W7DNI5_AMBMO|nr:unnamed protein product [Ambrosiozyma monospora]